MRAAKLVLPVLALVALGSYGARLLATSVLRPMGVAVPAIRIDSKNLVMETPKYDGFGKDGARYQVRAREAVTDIRQTGPVRLNDITGEITQPTGVSTKLAAVWGTYDQKKDVLELHERIEIEGSTGLLARLTRATILPKESRVLSNEPVWAQTETGTITAKSMTLDTKSRLASFKQSVHVRLEPNRTETPPGATAAPDANSWAAKTRSSAAAPGLSADPNQPIDVHAESLDVDDGGKTALFRRDVTAQQGEATLEAPELTIVYTGRAALEPSAKPVAGEPATKLRSISARGGVATKNKDDRANSDSLDYDAASQRAVLRGNVVMTSGADRRVTGEVAEFDQQNDVALITGEVVATQGRNILRGRRLHVDRRQSITRLDSPAANGQPVGRISTLFYQNERSGAAKAPTAKKSADAAPEDSMPLGVSFKTDPDAPIEVEADNLVVMDAKHTAVYRGNVVAHQGDFVVRTVELTAYYAGQTGLGSATTANPGDKSDPAGGAQLTRIETRQKVVVTSKDGREVIGDWADFDVKANTITVGGKVTVSNGRSSIDGPDGSRLVVNMTTGKSHFEHAPSAKPVAGSKGQPAVSASEPAASAATARSTSGSNEPCPEGLVCSKKQFRLVLYPKQAEEKAKQQLDKLTSESGPAAEIAAEVAKGKKPKKPKPDTSSWDATTSAPPSVPR